MEFNGKTILPAVNRLPHKVILYGGTGQAKVVRPIIEHYGSVVTAVFDDTPGLPAPFPDVPLYCGYEQLEQWYASHRDEPIGFCLAIGNPHGAVRRRLHDRLVSLGMRPVTIAHAASSIADNAVIGEGTQIMAGAVIGVEARVGRQCIINTRASVDHEDVLEDGVEISPGATLCGLVHVRRDAWVAAGATILPRLEIGAGAIVGAGAVVTRNVPPGATVMGLPARIVPSKLRRAG